MKQRFFRCNRCGQVVTKVKDTDLPLTCCMAEMEELVPNISDGATEKHVPCVKIEGDVVTVQIGSELHPMTDAHHIEWIAISTSCGVQRKELKKDQSPEVVFMLSPGECLKCVYAYCNLHGLWMKDVECKKEKGRC